MCPPTESITFSKRSVHSRKTMKVSGSTELELQEFGNCSVSMPGTELELSARAAITVTAELSVLVTHLVAAI